MFSSNWWKHKNSIKELTIGWLYNNQIKDDFARGYTKNLTDYWSVEMSFFLKEAFEDDTINALLKKAHDAGFKKILVVKQGTHMRWNFQTAFKEFYEKNKSAKLVGHILDQGDSYYTMHPQAFMVDLEWWAEVGFPNWGDKEYSINNEFETIEPLRSTENWHDEYTPHWISKSNISRVYKQKLDGWNIIKSAIEDGQTIISWNKEMRLAKHYSYAEVVYDGPRHLAGVLTSLEMSRLFFIANTETVRFTDSFINNRKLASPEWDGKFDQVIAPAAGLSSLIYAFKLGVPKNGSLVIYDISKFALEMTERIIKEWNGQDYSKFANKLMDSVGRNNKNCFKGGRELHHSDAVIEELNKQGFAEWIKMILPTLSIDYEEINMLNPNEYKYIVNYLKPNKITYVHLTNVFHYMPTAFYYSLKSRWALHNELLHLIKSKSHENNILLYSVCPVNHQPPINWTDDWNTTLSYNELPDSSIGKFLKWNK